MRGTSRHSRTRARSWSRSSSPRSRSSASRPVAPGWRACSTDPILPRLSSRPLETLALGALQEARARGLKVPGKLALAGCMDFPSAALMEPPLTMVSVPAREMGMQAMRILSDLIQGRKVQTLRRTVLDVELVVRESCGRH